MSLNRVDLADPAWRERIAALGLDPDRLPGVRYDRVETALRLRIEFDANPTGGRSAAWGAAENALTSDEFEVYQSRYSAHLSSHSRTTTEREQP